MALFSYRTQYPEVSTTRIEEFSDGVFSIVITLLVLNIAVPLVKNPAQEGALAQALITLLPKMLSFILSFIIIGVYWVAHHNIFVNIKSADRTLLWLNNLFLLFVTFLPFPTALIGQYGGHQLALVIYGVMIILTSFSLGLLWWYASTNNRLVDEHMNPRFRGYVLRLISVAPMLATVAIIVSFWNTKLCIGIYLLSTLIHFIPNRVFTNEPILAKNCPNPEPTQEWV